MGKNFAHCNLLLIQPMTLTKPAYFFTYELIGVFHPIKISKNSYIIFGIDML